METRSFNAPYLDFPSLTEALKQHFQFQKYEVQILNLSIDDTVIQIRQGGWRNMLGLSSALNIALKQRQGNLLVEIGAGKWADKAIAGTVSMFILWPLAFTAAYGAWQQSKLPQRTFDFIQQYVYTTA